MPYYIYILESLKDGKYYIESTSDLKERVRYHNAVLQRSTKHRIPLRLVYREALPDKSSTLKQEKQIKRYTGGNAFKRLVEGD